MVKQKTLKHAVQATGVGVHSGQRVLLTLRPAQPNTGIVFRRIEEGRVTLIPATLSHIDEKVGMSTALQANGVRICTVEHLLSALVGLGIDNAEIDVDAQELPIMDGSAGPFVFLAQAAGTQEQDAPKRYIRVKKTVKIKHKDSWATLSPCDSLRLNYELSYDHPSFTAKNSVASVDLSVSSYYTCVARARTFGFLADYERVKSMGYAAGSSLANSVVFDDYRVLNETGLRYPNECARHKILDAMGDLFLMGGPLLGEFTGYKSGHAINRLLAQALMSDEKAFEWVSIEEKTRPAQDIYNPGADPAAQAA